MPLAPRCGHLRSQRQAKCCTATGGRGCALVQQLLHERAELALVVRRQRAQHRQRLHRHALAGRRQRVEQRRNQDVQVVQYLQSGDFCSGTCGGAFIQCERTFMPALPASPQPHARCAAMAH